MITTIKKKRKKKGMVLPVGSCRICRQLNCSGHNTIPYMDRPLYG